MYPSSSSSQKSIQTTTASVSVAGLVRYGSAPSSFLSTAADSVAREASHNMSSSPSTRDLAPAGYPIFPPPPRPLQSSSLFGNYFSGYSQPSASKVNAPAPAKEGPTPGGGLHIAFGLTETGLGASPSSPAASASASASLRRQSSSPAGFLSHLASENGGSSLTCGAGTSDSGAPSSRLKTQLSFTRPDSSLSQASDNVVKGGSGWDNGHHHANQSSYTNLALDSWESSGNTVIFSPGKSAKTIGGDIYSFNTLETQFSLPQTTMEMATVERMLHIPDDSVPCKVGAKRGFATHPRSIAERERRTRISGRLKKLQELVPNMDKQTSYADMLDLAVEHIKTLQNHIQRLQRDLNNCTCGCKPS